MSRCRIASRRAGVRATSAAFYKIFPVPLVIFISRAEFSIFIWFWWKVSRRRHYKPWIQKDIPIHMSYYHINNAHKARSFIFFPWLRCSCLKRATRELWKKLTLDHREFQRSIESIVGEKKGVECIATSRISVVCLRGIWQCHVASETEARKTILRAVATLSGPDTHRRLAHDVFYFFKMHRDIKQWHLHEPYTPSRTPFSEQQNHKIQFKFQIFRIENYVCRRELNW